MITKLLETDLLAFQEKFYFFGDAVVSSLSFDYQNKQFRVILEAQDSSESIQPCWRFVTLILKECFSMKIIHGNAAYYIISDGLHILFENDNIGIEFGEFCETPQSMEELMTSSFHVVGKSLEWVDAACR